MSEQSLEPLLRVERYLNEAIAHCEAICSAVTLDEENRRSPHVNFDEEFLCAVRKAKRTAYLKRAEYLSELSKPFDDDRLKWINELDVSSDYALRHTEYYSAENKRLLIVAVEVLERLLILEFPTVTAWEDAVDAGRKTLNSIHVLNEKIKREQDNREVVSNNATDQMNQSAIRLLRVFTNNVADDRFNEAIQILSNEQKTVNDKLKEIDSLIHFPPTASAQQLAEMLQVSKTAIINSAWWEVNRKGEKANMIGRRHLKLMERSASFQSQNEDDE